MLGSLPSTAIHENRSACQAYGIASDHEAGWLAARGAQSTGVANEAVVNDGDEEEKEKERRGRGIETKQTGTGKKVA